MDPVWETTPWEVMAWLVTLLRALPVLYLLQEPWALSRRQLGWEYFNFRFGTRDLLPDNVPAPVSDHPIKGEHSMSWPVAVPGM